MDEWDKEESGKNNFKKYDPTSLNIPILASGLYCPICKDDTIVPPAQFYIDSLMIHSTELNIFIIHTKCHERFNVTIKIQDISCVLEGEVKYVH